MRRTPVLVVPALIVLLACTSGSDKVTGTQPGNGNTGSAPISATINGAAWGSTFTHTATYSTQLVDFSGFDGTTLIVIGVGRPNGPGTYSLAYLNANGSSAIVTVNNKGWNSYLQGGSGSITFSTLTSTRATGTFTFVAVPTVGGADGNMQVTNGKFDVTF